MLIKEIIRPILNFMINNSDVKREIIPSIIPITGEYTLETSIVPIIISSKPTLKGMNLFRESDATPSMKNSMIKKIIFKFLTKNMNRIENKNTIPIPMII